ncbi:alanine rich transmembrane protein [Nocardia sp. NRRL S-836]|nr:alanine rich transmembrane protein [Nocardia sp. NRRL S-836]
MYVTWWFWPLPLLAAVLLAAEVHMGFPGVRSWLPYAVLLPLTLVLIVRMGSTKVEVSGGELRVGEAHIPLSLLGEVEVIGPDGRRAAMGRELDPAAFVLHRGWVKHMVRVRVTDPEDPTPYWLVSTRHPERLAAALKG